MISHGLLEMILNETMPPSVGTISVGRITTKSSLETFTITQDGIVIETKNEEDAVNTMSGEGGEKTIEINSNVEWVSSPLFRDIFLGCVTSIGTPSNPGTFILGYSKMAWDGAYFRLQNFNININDVKSISIEAKDDPENEAGLNQALI